MQLFFENRHSLWVALLIIEVNHVAGEGWLAHRVPRNGSLYTLLFMSKKRG